ncbi:MAG TPA: glycosyltransferase family 2 protein [Candidatus Acidoferrum sp.]|nr:glycosyltransferase family 2 protein [Candidatus Acidoferrum sp.]
MKPISTIALEIFWLSIAVILYTYFIYPAVLLVCYSVSQLRTDLRYLFNRVDRRVGRFAKVEAPGVTFVVPAYNEEKHLPAKLANLRGIEYPREKLQVIIVSDGSTDGTNDILKEIQDPCVEPVILSQRGGKANALNCAVARASHDLLVFSDAGTMFEPDAVRKLVRHFANPQTGAACGALRFQASSESQQTEGVYWKYESALRLMESRLGASLNASGAVYALRREAYQPLAQGAVLDDLLVPMNARKLGYGVIYDPEAIATDYAPETIQGEFARRVRIAAGSFQALPELLRMNLTGFTAFSFYSHKLLRWLLPFFLIALLLSNGFLVGRTFYAGFAAAQILFYAWAILGGTCSKQLKRVRFGLIGHFLVAMNAAFLVGFFRYLKNRNSIEWQRVS